MPTPTWYLKRLSRMSPAEVRWRLEDHLRRETWARRTFGVPTRIEAAFDGRRPGPAAPHLIRDVLQPARQAVLSTAERLMAGEWEVLGQVRTDLVDPDWSLDPVSGRSFPVDRCAFRIDYRSAGDGRNVKQAWELSRHHHITLLAVAWRLTGDDRYADRAARHLRSWWQANPVLMGVNWCSGIEIGIRLISWVWARRLLDGWSGATALFEANEVCVRQVYWHQRWLAAFRSRGSSANNHVIAEAAGQLTASCAFAWFPESVQWRDQASRLLEDELRRNSFPSGLNREQAFDYHGLVAELGLVAAAEAEAAGVGLSAATWQLLCRMLDVLASVVDASGRPPRYGDGDDGRALVVDDPAASRWSSLLATGHALFGGLSWWPPTVPDVQSVLLSDLVGRQVDGGPRPEHRQSHFADAGLTILRAPVGKGRGLWCRCEGGPHGFLSIAGHAHADALSIEVRAGGIDLLADPGTYCYHSEPAFRSYFRSTLAHNTLELDETDQSRAGGPFMWMDHAATRATQAQVDGPGPRRWSAEHHGYGRLQEPAIHRRYVTLDPEATLLEIVDQLETAGRHRARLAFHLGPAIESELKGHSVSLWWTDAGSPRSATLELPEMLSWRAYRGSTDPVLGWYSAGFGRKQVATTLVGTGQLGRAELRSRLRLSPETGEPT